MRSGRDKKLIVEKHTPDPTAYDLSCKAIGKEGPKYSIAGRYSVKDDLDIPGPQAYTLSDFNKFGLKYSMSHKTLDFH